MKWCIQALLPAQVSSRWLWTECFCWRASCKILLSFKLKRNFMNFDILNHSFLLIPLKLFDCLSCSISLPGCLLLQTHRFHFDFITEQNMFLTVNMSHVTNEANSQQTGCISVRKLPRFLQKMICYVSFFLFGGLLQSFWISMSKS